MPDLYMDVDVALAEVPVNVLPLIDDTDFKSIEGAVAYNAGGMALRWHFVTSAGGYTVTSVTPTTGGDYDWTDQGDSGIYTIEIPASGGASINNDTEGYGWFTGVATGVLPWRGPVIGFRAVGLNDLLCDSAFSATRGLSGTALPNAAAEAAGGLYTRGTGAGQLNQAANGQVDSNAVAFSGDSVAADNAELMFDGTGYAGGTTKLKIDVETIKTQAVTCAAGVTVLASVGTAATSTAQTGDNFARLGAPAGASVSADVAAVKVDTAAILVDTGTTLDTAIADLPTNAELATALGTADDAVLSALSSIDGKLDTIDNFLDTEVAAILADTNELQTDWADGGRLDLILDARASQASVTTIDDFLDTEIAAILAAVDTEVAAIKAKTDGLTFTVATVLDANIQRINDVVVLGDGSATPWGP